MDHSVNKSDGQSTVMSDQQLSDLIKGGQNHDSISHLDSYRKNAVVHSATRLIAEKMSTIEFELYQLKNERAEKIEQHEILDLLERPNPFTTGIVFRELTQIYKTLVGDCYWYKARDNQGKVIELWIMRPDRVQIVQDDNGGIKEYIYTATTQMNFNTDDVIHFIEPDPLSDYYGTSAVQASIDTINADINAKKWNSKFFYNSARPDAVLTSDGSISNADRTDIKEKFIRKYGGVDNAHKVAVLGSGLSYQQISLSQKDMDFANMHNVNRDDVLMALRVPKSLMAITDDVSRANADAGIYAFLSQNIEPKALKDDEILNVYLVQEFDDDIVLAHVDPTPKDKEMLDNSDVKALDKWKTRNEIRLERGLEPLEGGDVMYIAMNQVELGEKEDDSKEDDKKSFMVIGKEGSALKAFKKKEDKRLCGIYKKAVCGRRIFRKKQALIKKISESVENKLKALQETQIKEAVIEEQKGFTKKEKDLAWKQFDKQLIPWEKKFTKMQKNLFKNQEKVALRNLKKIDLEGDVDEKDLEIIDYDKEVEIFRKKAKPMIAEMVKDGGNSALEQVGEKSIKKEFEISKETLDWIEREALEYAQYLNTTTIDRIKKELLEGVLEGESIDELAKRIDGIYDIRIKSDAETIARTEVLTAINFGTLSGFTDGGVEKKEWLATLDSRVRDAHLKADGQVVGINEKFDVGGEKLDFPGDGSAGNRINCRCTILPVIE